MKLIYSILVIIILGFIGFVASIFAALTGGMTFYVPLVVITTIGIIVFTILAIYGQAKKKTTKISMLTFVSLCALSILGYQIYEAYMDRLEIVSTQDVNLYEYRPFSEGSKAVLLDEESTYKIEDDLPKLDGATALYPVYSAFVQAVYPERVYELTYSGVSSSQTNNAFNHLIKGEVDIVFMAHPSKKQLSRAEQEGVELTMTPIGREAFVFFVNTRNPVEELTIKQIQGIYSGKITNWSEVGGRNESIRAFQRPEGSGSQTALQSVMGDVPLMKPPTEDIVSAMGGIIEQTSNYHNYRNSIGYSFRYFSEEMVQNGNIRNIAIEGIKPTKDNIQNGKYPIADQFYAITAGTENPHVEEFIKWMVSEQGQQIVEKTGYVPLN